MYIDVSMETLYFIAPCVFIGATMALSIMPYEQDEDETYASKGMLYGVAVGLFVTILTGVYAMVTVPIAAMAGRLIGIQYLRSPRPEGERFVGYVDVDEESEMTIQLHNELGQVLTFINTPIEVDDKVYVLENDEKIHEFTVEKISSGGLPTKYKDKIRQIHLIDQDGNQQQFSFDDMGVKFFKVKELAEKRLEELKLLIKLKEEK